jgi:hypothetical protein
MRQARSDDAGGPAVVPVTNTFRGTAANVVQATHIGAVTIYQLSQAESAIARVITQAARSRGAALLEPIADSGPDGTHLQGHRILNRLLREHGTRPGKREIAARLTEKVLAAANGVADVPGIAADVRALLDGDPDELEMLAHQCACVRDADDIVPLPQADAVRAACRAIETASRETIGVFSCGVGPNVGRLYVEGPAGTGKTILALTLAAERAQRVRESGGRALYLCYSQPLADELATVAASIPGAGGLDIHTPESLFRCLIPGRQATLDALVAEAVAEQDEFAEARDAAPDPRTTQSRRYLEADEFWAPFAAVPTRFAAVTVDEAQDFRQVAFTALAGLTAPDGLFAVFADPYQVTRADRLGRPWRRPVELDGLLPHRLEVNLRNTMAIAREVERLALVVYRFSGMATEGLPVRRSTWSDRESLLAALTAASARFTRLGLDPASDAAILVEECAAGEELRDLRRRGHHAGMPVFSADEFRGRERKAVVYVRGPLSDRAPLSASTEQCYVGLSRAVGFAELLDHPNW